MNFDTLKGAIYLKISATKHFNTFIDKLYRQVTLCQSTKLLQHLSHLFIFQFLTFYWTQQFRNKSKGFCSYSSLVTEPQGVKGAHGKHLSIWSPGQRGDRVVMRRRGVKQTTKAVPYLLREDMISKVKKKS